MSTSFWNIRWRGEVSLRTKYPRLFSISNQQEAKVGEVRRLEGNTTVWNLVWRRPFFAWEEQLYLNLLEDLDGVEWSLEEDVWKWSLEEGFFLLS